MTHFPVSSSRSSRLVAGSFLLGASLLLAGCGRETASVATTTTTTTAVVTTSSTTTDPQNAPAESQAGRSPAVSVAASQEMKHLVDVRAGRDADGSERVTFVFDGTAPGYSVAYADGAVVSPGSGESVTVAGSSVVGVKMSMASGFDLTGGLTQFYTGPKEITPSDTSMVKQLKQVGDYEGVIDWAIGLDADRPFTVSTPGPDTITIDFGA